MIWSGGGGTEYHNRHAVVSHTTKLKKRLLGPDQKEKKVHTNTAYDVNKTNTVFCMVKKLT